MEKKVKKSKVAFRLLKYVFTTYKIQFFIVFIAIFIIVRNSIFFIVQLLQFSNNLLEKMTRQNLSLSNNLREYLKFRGGIIV